MNEHEINKKLEYRDNLLDNEKKFKKYLNDIDNLEISIPDNLEKNIYKKIPKKTVKYKIDFRNLLKMVACIVFSVILWESVLSKNITYANSNLVTNQRINSISSFLDKKVNSVNNFFLEPIVEGGKVL